jgi:LPS sulfotransferase NodH
MNIPNANVQDDVDAVCVKSYLICAAPRTGSTLLSSMLLDTRVAGQPFEFIHDLSRNEFFARIGRPLGLLDYVKFLKQRRCSLNGVFGFKAQFNQLSDDLMSDFDTQRRFVGEFDKFVLIYRRNALAQAISHYRALLTGVWHATEEAGVPASGPIAEEYDAAGIARSLAALIGQSESWRRLLRKCGADWLEIAFEELIQDPVGILRRVMRYLEVDVEALQVMPSPRLRRQSDAISRDWEQRFVADLLGTPARLPHGGKVLEPVARLMKGRMFRARS